MNDIEKQIKKLGNEDISNETDNDIDKIKSFLKTGNIEENFNKRQVKSLVSRSNVLGDNQNKKLNKALDKIFK